MPQAIPHPPQFIASAAVLVQAPLQRVSPVPHWHEGDGGRYLGTALMVITRDPETGMENVGCYRVMLQGKNKLGLHMSPGKHGRIHLDKATKAGKPLPNYA